MCLQIFVLLIFTEFTRCFAPKLYVFLLKFCSSWIIYATFLFAEYCEWKRPKKRDQNQQKKNGLLAAMNGSHKNDRNTLNCLCVTFSLWHSYFFQFDICTSYIYAWNTHAFAVRKLYSPVSMFSFSTHTFDWSLEILSQKYVCGLCASVI